MMILNKPYCSQLNEFVIASEPIKFYISYGISSVENSSRICLLIDKLVVYDIIEDEFCCDGVYENLPYNMIFTECL